MPSEGITVDGACKVDNNDNDSVVGNCDDNGPGVAEVSRGSAWFIDIDRLASDPCMGPGKEFGMEAGALSSGGRSSARMTLPLARMKDRSMAFSNSRIFPGQE